MSDEYDESEELAGVVDSETYYEDANGAPVEENGAAAAVHHTKFLDLTNGEGGDRYAAASAAAGAFERGEANDADTAAASTHHVTIQEAPAPAPVAVVKRKPAKMDVDALADAQIIRSDRFPGGARMDPNTPGKVVEAGQEHTGRWTKEEHESFLSALQMYGKEWKKVAAKVKTRTVVQTRTHAQKYFQKLQKAMEGGAKEQEVGQVEMGVAPEAKKVSSSIKKRKNPPPSIASKPRPSNISASQLLSNLTTAAQSIQTPTSDSQARLNAGFGGGGGGALSMAGAAILSRAQQSQSQFPPRHGFSTGSDAFRSSAYAAPGNFGSLGDRGWAGSTAASSTMKITAPDPDASVKSGMFPEPSPAACGKRKLAEIAAARMLAGVAAGGRPLLGSVGAPDPDGDVTPPPQESPRRADAPGLSLRDVPAPPLMGSMGGASAANAGGRKAMTLQIVNPESLGIDEEEAQKKRRANGTGEETPWDGQLEALVSEKAKEKMIDDMEEDVKLPAAIRLPAPAGTHPICNHGTSYSRSRLHKAVCEMDLASVQRELAAANSEMLNRKDDLGYCPLHTACSLGLLRTNRLDVPCEIVRQLISSGADPCRVDENGNTPLHWSARAGDKEVTELLLRKNCPKDAQNKQGETPLHWAMRAGQSAMDVVGVLLENGARAAALNKSFKRPVDIAADGFDDESGSIAPKRQPEKALEEKRKRITKEEKRLLMEVTEERKLVRESLLRRSAQSRTLVLHHPECLEHTPKSSTDWEAPDRITAIMGLVGTDGNATGRSVVKPYEITASSEFERAKLDLLSRVHSTDYLAFVNDLSKELERRQKEEEEAASGDSDDQRTGTLTPPVVPFTPMVQRSMIKIEESRVKLGAHSDTSFSVGSLRAARRAAGAVQHAVDCVLVGRNRNAMCIVRPPGHHAGMNGLLDGGESCGFCIFNNVAAGALHAISDERLLCERCAIVDIDVHHGNGTEEIVKKCHDPGKLFFFSIHLYDNDEKKRKGNAFQYKFYPGTGAEDDVAFNIINVGLKPLWKEPQPEKSSNNTHNTRGKSRRHVPSSDSMDDSSELGTPRDSKDNGRFSDADSEAAPAKGPALSPGGAGSSVVSSSSATSASGRFAYRQAIQNRLVPSLRAFNPDLILISAGFDAARLDVGNARHERGGERMGLDLEPEDYAWTTRKILEVADICCQGRVVSVLEGGYGRSAPNNEPGLDRSNLAECAARHLHAMVDPYDSECRFPA